MKRTIQEFYNKHFVANAMGGFENIRNTNCKEALEESYRLGRRFFEADIRLSSDNELLCINGYEPSDYTRIGLPYAAGSAVLSKEQWVNSRLFMKYTPLVLEDIFSFMEEHEDCRFLLDMHDLEKGEAYQTAVVLEEKCKKSGIEPDRFVFQVLSEDMLLEIKQVIAAPYFQLYVKQEDMEHLDRLIRLCCAENVFAMGIRADTCIEDIEYVKNCILKIKSAGLHLMVTVINDAETAEQLFKLGADLICTDYLYEKEDGSVGDAYDDRLGKDYGVYIDGKYFPPDKMAVYKEGEVYMISAKYLCESISDLKYIYSGAPGYKAVITNLVNGQCNIYTRYSDVYEINGSKHKAPYICRSLYNRIYVPLDTVTNVLHNYKETVQVVENVH